MLHFVFGQPYSEHKLKIEDLVYCATGAGALALLENEQIAGNMPLRTALRDDIGIPTPYLEDGRHVTQARKKPRFEQRVRRNNLNREIALAATGGTDDEDNAFHFVAAE